MATPPRPQPKLDLRPESFRFHYFTELLKRPVYAATVQRRLGKLTDLVFRLSEPYPECVGFYLEHGWGKPTEFIPWERLLKIDQDGIFVEPPPGGEATYPPFVDQQGWLLVDMHLMGRTILDMDGRRTEVVNDVHLLESRQRMLLVHVDFSFNGFLRRWGLGRVRWIKDRLIAWKYVQPLSVEDVVTTDQVSLSVTRNEVRDLPGEDLADILEELSGKEQQALFGALDAEKAAEALVEAEPRAQRQLIANLRKERARTILGEMSAPQLADLFMVLPHDDMTELMALLPGEQAERIRELLSEREATARALMSAEYVAVPKELTVGEVLKTLRHSGREPDSIGYIFCLEGSEKVLVGVVDLRELVLAEDSVRLEDIMTSPVVSAEADDIREDISEIFARYHYRMIPVVDAHDHMLGVIHYNDIM